MMRTAGDNHSFLMDFSSIITKALRGAILILPGHPADAISEGTYTHVGKDCLWVCLFVTIGKLSVTQVSERI